MYDDLDQMREVLWSDLMTAFEAYKASVTQYSRRVFVRAGICFLDGITYDVRETVARSLSVPHCAAPFTDAERGLLSDRRALEREHRNLADRFRFCLTMMAKPFYRSTVIDTEKDPGWSAFKRALKVRHRVTHPQSPEDLDVSPQDVLDLATSCHWTASRAGFVLDRMAERINAPKDVIDTLRESRSGVDRWLDEHGYRRPT